MGSRYVYFICRHVTHIKINFLVELTMKLCKFSFITYLTWLFFFLYFLNFFICNNSLRLWLWQGKSSLLLHSSVTSHLEKSKIHKMLGTFLRPIRQSALQSICLTLNLDVCALRPIPTNVITVNPFLMSIRCRRIYR